MTIAKCMANKCNHRVRIKFGYLWLCEDCARKHAVAEVNRLYKFMQELGEAGILPDGLREVEKALQQATEGIEA